MRCSLSGRVPSRPPLHPRFDTLLARIAGGLSTAADARKLRVLLTKRAIHLRGTRR